MMGITKAPPLRQSKILRTATLRAKPTHTRQIQMQMHATSTPAASASPSPRKAICPTCARRHVLIQCRHHPQPAVCAPHQRRARPISLLHTIHFKHKSCRSPSPLQNREHPPNGHALATRYPHGSRVRCAHCISTLLAEGLRRTGQWLCDNAEGGCRREARPRGIRGCSWMMP